jgi:hypothetical protein
MSGKVRSGWLNHPTLPTTNSIVVAEQPVVLRASPDAAAQIEYSITPQSIAQPIVQSWVVLVQNGVALTVGSSNTILILSLPGVYRVNPLGPQPTHLSYEEDGRAIEWDAKL